MSARVYSPGVATDLHLTFLCLNVGHELPGMQAVVSVSRPVRLSVRWWVQPRRATIPKHAVL